LGETFPNQDFEVMTTTWGAGIPYPLNSVGTVVYTQPTWFGDNPTFPTEYEVPPLGEPDGSTSTVNVEDLYAEMTAAGPDEAQQLIKQMSWLINQRMPRIPVNEKTANNIFNVGDFEVTDPQFIGPAGWDGWMVDQGMIRATEQSPSP
jgi:peptide/nickel transport system substrate-binding protein